MSKTFRVTFHEWQRFELFVPAQSPDDAILIAETMRHSIGTVRPIVECDGGTDAFEASALPEGNALSPEALAELEAALLVMEESGRLNRNSKEARTVHLLRTALAKAKGGGPC
jgi:hypothetical protein